MSEMKEVFFNEYCSKCKHYDEKTEKDEIACNECLSETVNLYSHKPVKFEEKK